MAKRSRTPAWPDRVGAVAVLSSSALPLQRQPFEHKVRILQDAKGNKYFACAEADSVTHECRCREVFGIMCGAAGKPSFKPVITDNYWKGLVSHVETIHGDDEDVMAYGMFMANMIAMQRRVRGRVHE